MIMIKVYFMGMGKYWCYDGVNFYKYIINLLDSEMCGDYVDGFV